MMNFLPFPNKYSVYLAAMAIAAATIPSVTHAICSNPITLSKPLTLNKDTIKPGETITGTMTFTNNNSCTIKVEQMTVGTRPPGFPNACHGSTCSKWGFSPDKQNFTLQPGESITYTGTFTPTAADPSGQWRAYPAYLSGGTWWDNNDAGYPQVFYTVTDNNGGGGSGSSSGGSSPSSGSRGVSSCSDCPSGYYCVDDPLMPNSRVWCIPDSGVPSVR